jgi:3D (Asp-Asp-Asp) domain-containing protein
MPISDFLTLAVLALAILIVTPFLGRYIYRVMEGERVFLSPVLRPTTEKGGRRNAIGKTLSGQGHVSAAADWSRFPLGTRFQIVGTQDRYVIDDYGGALVGTNTIDLYMTSRRAMRLWGVRCVDIDILEWGSKQMSLEVLAPRKKNGLVRRMIAGIERNKS